MNLNLNELRNLQQVLTLPSYGASLKVAQDLKLTAFQYNGLATEITDSLSKATTAMPMSLLAQGSITSADEVYQIVLSNLQALAAENPWDGSLTSIPSRNVTEAELASTREARTITAKALVLDRASRVAQKLADARQPSLGV